VATRWLRVRNSVDSELSLRCLLAAQLWRCELKASGYVPVGFNTLTVHLTVDKAAQYIEFLKQAFDAVELTRSRSADGRLLGHRFSSAVVHPKRRTDWLSRLGGTAT